MPIYEYDCEDCHYKFSQFVSHRDTQISCPLCQGNVKKLMSTFSIGGSHNTTGDLPFLEKPKMCTNC